MSKFAIVLISAVLLAGCTSVNVNQTTQLSNLNAQQQSEFIAQAKTKNAEASKNFKSEGKVNFKVKDKVGIFDFTTDKIESDLKITMSVDDKKVLSIKKNDITYIGDGTTWLEMDNSTTAGSSFLDTDKLTQFDGLVTSDYAYIGVKDCSVGKCQVFDFKQNGSINRVYFGSDYLVSDVDLTVNDSVSGKFVMKYGKAESFAAPVNAEKATGLNSIGKLLTIYSPLFTAAGVDLSSLN